jgi:hypothetical protein
MQAINRLLKTLGDHPGQVVAAAVTLVLALRLMAVAAWNEQTALAILRESGTGTLLLGTLITVLTLAVLGVPILIGALVAFAPLHDRRWWSVWRWGIPFATIVLFVREDLLLIIGVFGLWATSPLIRRLFTPDKPVQGSDAVVLLTQRIAGGVGVVITLGGAAFFGVIGDQPWGPDEAVRTPDGHAHLGWVLRADQEVVMLSNDRRVVYLKGPLLARAICQGADDEPHASIVMRLGWPGGEPYPPCSTTLV